MKYYHYARVLLGGILASFICVSMCGCGYSKEEKQRMKEIEQIGGENAVNYVREKYGFTAEAHKVTICMERGDSDPLPWANGYVLADMSYGDEKFKVHISGEGNTLKGGDDFQRELIAEEGKKYFEELLGYKIYDIYLEYKEEEPDRDVWPSCHEKWFLEEKYEEGNFEKFLREHCVSMRIDDCTDQDLTQLCHKNPKAEAFFREYARDYGMKAILISYKSAEDYERGYEHTYARGGTLDFGIWKDGLYVNSYGAFQEDDKSEEKFELQEYDSMIFSCFDREPDRDLTIEKGKSRWMELGETRKKAVSEVYSVVRDGPGETTVYIPVEKYGKNVSVFVQHFDDDKWWQYEAGMDVTKDGTYVFMTYQGVGSGSFNFAVFD